MRIGRKLKNVSSLPVAAMADIAFLLLIFFILSSVTEEDKEIKIELPKSHISSQENEKFINVWIDSNGKIFYSGKEGSNAGLTAYSTRKLRTNPELRVLIKADKDVKYEHVNSTFDALKEAGVRYIILVSEKKS